MVLFFIVLLCIISPVLLSFFGIKIFFNFLDNKNFDKK